MVTKIKAVIKWRGKLPNAWYFTSVSIIIFDLYSFHVSSYLKIIGIVIFVGAWTPYAIVVCTSMFIDPEIIGPMAATLPALIAKSSMFWSSLYFLYTNSNIRKCIKQFDTENLQTGMHHAKLT